MKTCPRCGRKPPEIRFHKNKHRKEGLCDYCTSCSLEKRQLYLASHPERGVLRNRKNHLKAKFGLTLEDYERMLQEQNGKCAICSTKNPGKYPFVVDHCHTTSQVRGLLCTNCNSGIGKLQDSIPLLNSAITYLQNHQNTEGSERECTPNAA